MTTSGKRLLFVALNFPPEPSGTAPFTGSMAAAMRHCGWETHVLSARPHYPGWKLMNRETGWAKTQVSRGVIVRRVWHLIPKVPNSFTRVLAEVSFGLRACVQPWERPSVVVLVSPALLSSALAMLRARMFNPRTPCLVWVQDLYARGLGETGQGGQLAARAIARLERALFSTADSLVVIHESFRDWVVDAYNVEPERITIVRNWSRPLPPAQRTLTEARQALSWPVDRIVALHLGNMGIKQGLANVVQAARTAFETGAPVHFALIGGGSEKAALERLGQGLPNLHFHGSMTDQECSDALAAADVLLVNEAPGVANMAVPSKLTTYFASGKPVVAAVHPDGTAAHEINASGAGVIVEPDNPQAMITAVLRIGRAVELGNNLGLYGMRYSSTALSEAQSQSRFHAVLRKMMDGDFQIS